MAEGEWIIMIQKNDAINYLNTGRNYIVNRFPFLKNKSFRLDKSLETGRGYTNNDAYGVHGIRIGVKEIVDCESQYISDFTFMKAFVSEFHEGYGHCDLIQNGFEKSDDLYSVIALNHYACLSSNSYYNGKNLNNYFHQSHEIAAQYLGIKSCYEFSKNLFGEEKAKQLICDYVNERIRLHSEFVDFKNGKPYESVQSILDEFNHTFNKSIHKHKEFDTKVALREPSSFGYYFHNHPNEVNSKLVSLRRDGIIQDVMMTSIYLHEEDPNDILRNRVPVFGNKNLYIGRAFDFGNDMKKHFRGKIFDLAELTPTDRFLQDDEVSDNVQKSDDEDQPQ